ncbi:hypothetical protein J5N97_004757 [Dioscorea zingiberensis]|uniref:Uncharacterized protein n=1 Tax=Dioscorea zingiberensis TaxID=325984 RepID=A0A9D5HS53_9LILI|nr:hypothetical protein J5N97_004757 [Dioscorea zingiberensis]
MSVEVLERAPGCINYLDKDKLGTYLVGISKVLDTKYKKPVRFYIIIGKLFEIHGYILRKDFYLQILSTSWSHQQTHYYSC